MRTIEEQRYVDDVSKEVLKALISNTSLTTTAGPVSFSDNETQQAMSRLAHDFAERMVEERGRRIEARREIKP